MDMLIALYALTGDGRAPSDHAAGVTVRKPIGPEHDAVVRWVADRFGAGWASEVGVALGNRPVTVWLAVRDAVLVGFCCHDATARGFVGPIGVAADEREHGIGARLLMASLREMRATGYGYAVAGGVGAPAFFERVAGAVAIDGSTPGMYADRLHG
jgi:GNAT superfamily N-acetyltransferase